LMSLRAHLPEIHLHFHPLRLCPLLGCRLRQGAWSPKLTRGTRGTHRMNNGRWCGCCTTTPAVTRHSVTTERARIPARNSRQKYQTMTAHIFWRYLGPCDMECAVAQVGVWGCRAGAPTPRPSTPSAAPCAMASDTCHGLRHIGMASGICLRLDRLRSAYIVGSRPPD
jgi:hypothetical protein